MTEPIRKSVTVPLRPDDAFDLFTASMDVWWPKDSHSVSAQEGLGHDIEITVEPHEGGHVIETRPDGSTSRWATVTTWDPGHRFALAWYPGRSAEEATDVEVVFSETELGTRVDLTHGGFERLGAAAETMGASYSSGWDHVLGQCYGTACQARAA